MSYVLTAVGWQLEYATMRKLRAVCRASPRVRPHHRYYQISIAYADVALGKIVTSVINLSCARVQYGDYWRDNCYAAVSRCDCSALNFIIVTNPYTRARREAYMECCSMSKCAEEYLDTWYDKSNIYGFGYAGRILRVYRNGKVVYKKEFP